MAPLSAPGDVRRDWLVDKSGWNRVRITLAPVGEGFLFKTEEIIVYLSEICSHMEV